jgi:hypothetical protein
MKKIGRITTPTRIKKTSQKKTRKKIRKRRESKMSLVMMKWRKKLKT